MTWEPRPVLALGTAALSAGASSVHLLHCGAAAWRPAATWHATWHPAWHASWHASRHSSRVTATTCRDIRAQRAMIDTAALGSRAEHTALTSAARHCSWATKIECKCAVLIRSPCVMPGACADILLPLNSHTRLWSLALIASILKRPERNSMSDSSSDVNPGVTH